MQVEIDLVLYSLAHSAVTDYNEGNNNAIKIEGSMRRGFVFITSCWIRGSAGKNCMSWKSSHGIILSLTPGKGDGTINSDGSVDHYPIGAANTDIFLIDFLGRKLAKHMPRVFGEDYETLRLNNREIIDVLPLIPNNFRENDNPSRKKKTIQLSVSREKNGIDVACHSTNMLTSCNTRFDEPNVLLKEIMEPNNSPINPKPQTLTPVILVSMGNLVQCAMDELRSLSHTKEKYGWT